MSESLSEIREKIDAIDDQILDCILKRSSLLDDVLAAKRASTDQNALPVFDPNREQKIIRRLQKRNNSVLSDHAIAEIFEAIIRTCRDYQIEQTNDLVPFSVSIQGEKGSYSEEAFYQYCQEKKIQHSEIIYDKSSENVLNSVTTRRVDYGLVALNNSQGGLVRETIRALLENPYRIISSVVLLVRHSLLMQAGESKESLTAIYSHPQALAQCRDYIARHYPQCACVPWADTALAAQDCANGTLPAGSAVIAHKRCADQIHGLQVIDQDIQDMASENETLFLLITHRH